MIDIKIYTNELVPLTTLVMTSEPTDFINLEYKTASMSHGSASFLMQLNNPKATAVNLKHYNIVEFIESGTGKVEWSGVIVSKEVSLNTISVQCYGYSYILEKIITGATYTFNAWDGAAITTLYNYARGIRSVFIDLGAIANIVNVNKTVNYSTVWEVMKGIAGVSGGQIMVTPDRYLKYGQFLGNDLSNSVVFKYDIDRIDEANITSFNVSDDGTGIVTKFYGKSKTFSSNQTNTALLAEYGLLQKYDNVRDVNDQLTLDSLCLSNTKGSKFTPRIDPIPSFPDTFEVYDYVKVILKNKLVDIEQIYQIKGKSVKIDNGVKRISVDISDNSSSLLSELKAMQTNLNLINQEV